MKKNLTLLSLLLLGIIFQTASAQVTPVVSTTADPIWYYIESGAVNIVGVPNSSLTDLLPLKGQNYVVYPAGAAGEKMKIRKSLGAEIEHWALIELDGKQYLKNRETGRYLAQSWTTVAAANDHVILTELGDNYYSIRSASRESAMNIWNDLTVDRWTADLATKDNLLSWAFKLAEELTELDYAILEAEQAVVKYPGGTNPGEYNLEAQADLRAAIDAARAVKDGTEQEKADAIAALIVAKNALIAAINPIKISSEANETWYYIVNTSTQAYANGKVIVNTGTNLGATIQFTQPSLDPNKAWQFVDAGAGKVAIKNMASGYYMPANPRGNGTTATPVAFTATFLGEGAQMTFAAAGQSPLHAQDAGSLLVTWAGGLNTASSWKLVELTSEELASELSINSVELKQRYTETGIGNRDHNLSYAVVTTTGIAGDISLSSVDVSFEGTNNIDAIETVKVYATGSDTRIDTSKHQLLGTLIGPSSNSAVYTIAFDEVYNLNRGTTNIYFVADISANADEGDLLKINLQSLNYDNNGAKSFVPAVKTVTHPTTVFLVQSYVFFPGDYNSVSYRIPAIIIADDGAIVSVTDKRKYNSGDLPGDIDIVSRRSTDGGKTWDAPVNMAVGTGQGKGYGDACVMKTSDGKLVALYVGGVGFFNGTFDNPQRMYVSTSDDHGQSWTAPRDITSQIYGFENDDSERSKWDTAFFGSGRGTTLRDGRLMAAITVRKVGASGGYGVHAVYSDDNGETWQVSERAAGNGDESKVLELNDGTILMSIRTSGNRRWAKSSDRGVTWYTEGNWPQIWGNACDADLVRFTSTVDGHEKDRLLHTLPNASNRSNLTMWISYNEGDTWGTKKTICPITSAYSSIVTFGDGTIGVYYETDETSAYTMSFVRFSLDWLTDGADQDTMTSVALPSGKGVQVWSENGVVKVSDNIPFKLYSVSGASLPVSSKLNDGVYLVQIENQVVKLLVK